ncbi:MAG: hypothetical protein LUG52_10595, partial [Clostridia bacterium]|nr:hypothetical protein [Clostridia bacterium]
FELTRCGAGEEPLEAILRGKPDSYDTRQREKMLDVLLKKRREPLFCERKKSYEFLFADEFV